MNRMLLLAAICFLSQSAAAQYYRLPSPYEPGARHAPYGWYHSPPYARGQWSTFDGGLYGTYGGYQPLTIRTDGGPDYANPSYLGPSYRVGPSFTLDNGLYSLGARKNLPSPQSLARNRMGGEIRITHRADASQELHYAINGVTHIIKPGGTQTHINDRSHIIAFGSGGPKGDLHYTLRAANYRFIATEKGWDLKQIVKKEGNRPDNPSP